MSNRKLKFNIENIGPLKNLNNEFNSDSLKIALFATNGSGKTFIGRCFNVLSDIQQNINYNDFKNLINFDSSEARFLFDFSDTSNKNILKFKINKDSFLEKEINSNFIIHVFNKQFVDKNVARNNYAIDSDNITGEILIGDETIDVAKDEADLKALKDKLNDITQKITAQLKVCWDNVASLGIRTNLTEFTQINYPNLLKQKHYTGISFESAKNNYSTIKNIPDNLEEIKYLGYTLDTNLFRDIDTAIKTPVNLSTIGEEFKKKVLTKTTFIKEGLQLLEGDKSKCPFCENSLEEKSDLINQYIEYFNQEEAKFDEKLEDLKGRLQLFEKDINNIEKDYNKISLLFCEQKKYFVDLKNIDFKNFPNKDSLTHALTQIKNLLQEKSLHKNKISFTLDLESQENIINQFLENLENLKTELNNHVKNIEKKKSEISSEQTKSRREVCLSAFGELYNSQEDNIKQVKQLDTEIDTKQKEINIKKAVNKKNKKDKVHETFEKYLKEFFNDKYTFNRDKRCLSLNKHLIETNAENVLSEGEKNIIGFCYYLALTYKKINSKQDCENLLFVIDDPISSMDYHYVYKVADIIRNLGKELNCSRYRFITLTHNYEFLNLLIKNNISSLNLILSNNILTELKKETILPYTEHLNFINDVANGNRAVSFQTPNSMRHVLETICNFSCPNKKLKDFIAESEVLADNEYLLTAIHDLSHGAIRVQKPFTDDDIQEGCKKIIEYIKQKYAGQIDNL